MPHGASLFSPARTPARLCHASFVFICIYRFTYVAASPRAAYITYFWHDGQWGFDADLGDIHQHYYQILPFILLNMRVMMGKARKRIIDIDEYWKRRLDDASGMRASLERYYFLFAWCREGHSACRCALTIFHYLILIFSPIFLTRAASMPRKRGVSLHLPYTRRYNYEIFW